MAVKIKLLRENAKVPTYAHPDDACFDCYASVVNINNDKGYVEYGLGFAIEIPKGYYMELKARSSLRNLPFFIPNDGGIIDSNYRGEVKVTFKHQIFRINLSDINIPYQIGERCVQAIIKPYPKVKFKTVDKLSETDRGDGGHGSTGK